MVSRLSYPGLILIAVTVIASVAGYVYVVPALFPAPKLLMTIIHIHQGSGIPPSGWHNFTDLSSPTFHYPVNITVTVGTNNTIEWINDDKDAHTVTFLVAPAGSGYPNSGFLDPGTMFRITLTVPGTYRYNCAWHNWLAGVIRVKPA